VDLQTVISPSVQLQQANQEQLEQMRKLASELHESLLDEETRQVLGQAHSFAPNPAINRLEEP